MSWRVGRFLNLQGALSDFESRQTIAKKTAPGEN